MRNEMVVSISSVIARIKNVLTQTMDLDGIWVQGEISNLTKHRSGHYYFSLNRPLTSFPFYHSIYYFSTNK